MAAVMHNKPLSSSAQGPCVSAFLLPRRAGSVDHLLVAERTAGEFLGR